MILSRLSIPILLLITLLAFALRTYNLDKHGIFYDEKASVFSVHGEGTPIGITSVFSPIGAEKSADITSVFSPIGAEKSADITSVFSPIGVGKSNCITSVFSLSVGVWLVWSKTSGATNGSVASAFVGVEAGGSTIAGGGGLIQLPAYFILMPGFSTASLFGSNKFAGFFRHINVGISIS